MLELERNYYQSIKDELLERHHSQFALIHGEELIGTYNTEEEAYKEGVRRFGANPFLIQQIQEQEPTDKYPSLVLGLINADSQPILPRE